MESVNDLKSKNKQLEGDLKKLQAKYNSLQLKLVRAEEDVKHATQKNRNIKLQGLTASLIFLLSSVLSNIGTALLLALNPPLGGVIIFLAVIAYGVAALMTTQFTQGGN